MELIDNAGAAVLQAVVEVWATIIGHPIAFAIISTIVLGAAVVAGILDEAGREVDALIEDALDPDQEANQ